MNELMNRCKYEEKEESNTILRRTLGCIVEWMHCKKVTSAFRTPSLSSHDVFGGVGVPLGMTGHSSFFSKAINGTVDRSQFSEGDLYL